MQCENEISNGYLILGTSKAPHIKVLVVRARQHLALSMLQMLLKKKMILIIEFQGPWFASLSLLLFLPVQPLQNIQLIQLNRNFCF